MSTPEKLFDTEVMKTENALSARRRREVDVLARTDRKSVV